MYRKGGRWTVGASKPRPYLRKFCKVYESKVTVICCGKSVSHVIGLKPVNIIDRRYICLVAETFNVDDSLAISLMDRLRCFKNPLTQGLYFAFVNCRFGVLFQVQLFSMTAKDACKCDEL